MKCTAYLNFCSNRFSPKALSLASVSEPMALALASKVHALALAFSVEALALKFRR